MTTEHDTSGHTTTRALVTGANKGIGFETVRQLLGLGWQVWLGARDEELGAKAVAELAPLGDVRLLVLDVTSDESVEAAVATITEDGGLDVLVNNAGIAGALAAPGETVPTDFIPVYGVNVLGPVRMTHAFLPLLRDSANPRIVNVSSGMGSFGVTTDSGRLESTLYGLVYPSSKSALNMITTMYAKSLPWLKINAVDPGYTATDLNGHNGVQSVETGAVPVVRMASIGTDGPTGTFTGQEGDLPW
ncbi:SDR family NAD(P)-dependent oxidoreductase [Nocardioides sp. Root151]|uniref:SDR family NAD(P)-dependent oxidoreductase n=1 Tax=Nocardioides sp. Root151 TaxID=1736475 RepID=UPI000702C14F|nr:SDR family NAD(P)-dependent oxidoreductase [Nocardioides sp. Root151]KQZ70130.1 short-chain dehydrogenase [Nocardioides sp. Root151]